MLLNNSRSKDGDYVESVDPIDFLIKISRYYRPHINLSFQNSLGLLPWTSLYRLYPIQLTPISRAFNRTTEHQWSIVKVLCVLQKGTRCGGSIWVHSWLLSARSVLAEKSTAWQSLERCALTYPRVLLLSPRWPLVNRIAEEGWSTQRGESCNAYQSVTEYRSNVCAQIKRVRSMKKREKEWP